MAATTTYVGVRAVGEISDMVGRRESSSSSYTTTCFEQKTIFDWWQNGLSYEEYEKLKDWGYDTRTTCFPLEELKTMLRHEVKALGKPTEEDGFKPKKGWDGETLVREPNGNRKGYPHKDGSVWVPTGKDPSNPYSHGGPHWGVEYPDGNYRNVRPKKK